MIDLDDMLAQLGDAPVHQGLAEIDEAVLAGVATHGGSGASISARPLSIAALAALAFGVVSTGFPGAPAAAATSLSPFGAPPALAPSSLLLAE